MIGNAGILVAMNNGVEELKKAADYIAPDNDDAGVAQIIEKLVLL